MAKLTIISSCCGTRLRRDGCNGSLILAKESGDEPCCCGKCGCTNPHSPNYDPEAVFDDGSCRTCCNQGLCAVADESPCKGANCNSVGNGCCDSGCLPCNGTGRDCSNSFDNMFTPTNFCPGTEPFTYHDCYTCPQNIKSSDDNNQPPAFLELQEILESKFGGPYASPDDRRRLTLLPEKISVPYDPAGPGTLLSSFFALFGIRATPECICSFRAYVMDVMGCKWCLMNAPRIATWLGQEAQRRKIPYTRAAGFSAVLCAVFAASIFGLFQRKLPVYG